MPILPRIQPNQSGGGAPRVPQGAFGGGFGEAIASFGDQLGAVAQKLQYSEDEIALARLTGEYDLQLAEAQLALRDDPDYLTHPNKFIEAENKIRTELLKSTDRKPVQGAFQAHISRRFPSQLISVKSGALELLNNKQVADLNGLEETMLAQVARSQSEEERIEHVATYEEMITRAERRGILDPTDAEKKRSGFRQSVQFGSAIQDARVDPVGTLERLAEKYPLLDAKHMEAVISRAMTQSAKIERENEKLMKETRSNAILEDFIAAANGSLSREQLEKNARRFGYSDEDFSKLRGEIERGGTTDPNVLIGLETSIRSGKPPSMRSLAGRTDLSAEDKLRLFALIDQVAQRNQERKGDHFSKSPVYEQAVREVRTAISRKGPLESLDPQEQKTLLYATQQLWDRTGKGEDPLSIAREIISRIPSDEGFGVGAPMLAPKYATEDEMLDAFKQGLITEAEAEQEAKIFERIKQEQARKQRSQQLLQDRKDAR